MPGLSRGGNATFSRLPRISEEYLKAFCLEHYILVRSMESVEEVYAFGTFQMFPLKLMHWMCVRYIPLVTFTYTGSTHAFDITPAN